jgi:hypothetical protein
MEQNKPLELPQQWVSRIEGDAIKAASLHFHPVYSPDQNNACQITYRNGAMSYAPWLYTCQTNYAALQAKSDRYEKALKEAEYALRLSYNVADLGDEKSLQAKAIITITEALAEWKGEKELAPLPAGDQWKGYITQFEKLNEFWNNLPETTALWLAQQIDIFASVYPKPTGAVWVRALNGLPLHKAFWNMPGEHLNNECYFPVRIDGFKYRVGEIFDNRQEGAPDPIYYFYRIEWLDESAGEKEVNNG